MNEYIKRSRTNSLNWPDRLYPPKNSRLYHHLSSLRVALEQVITQYIEKLNTPILFDFGCGEMPYLPIFQTMGVDYRGYDLTGNERAYGTILSDGRLDCDADSADIVLSSQVLEHVDNPTLYLQESHRVLKSGGMLILSTHGVWRYHPDPVDYWRWTGPGLRKVLSDAGFEIMYFKGVVGPEAAAIQLWQDAKLARIPNIMHGLFCRYCQWRMKSADLQCNESTKLDDAQVFLCLAKKM